MADAFKDSVSTTDVIVGGGRLRIDVRGKLFSVKLDSIQLQPQSKLYELYNKPSDEEVAYVNRDPTLLPFILRYYSQGELHLPDGFCRIHLAEELKFWDEDKHKATLSGKSFRNQMWDHYWNPDGLFGYIILTASWILHIMFLMVFLISPRGGDIAFDDESDITVTTMPPPDDYYDYDYNTSQRSEPKWNWKVFVNGGLLLVLSLWYTCCMILCPSFRHYYLTKRHLFYVLVLFFQWLPLVLVFGRTKEYSLGLNIFIYFMLISRSFLFLPLLGHFRTGLILGRAFSRSLKYLLAVLFIFLLNTSFFGCFILGMEDLFDEQDINDVLSAYWLAMETLTTIGYGYLIPLSYAGKIACWLCAFSGIIILALIVVILWHSYIEEWKKELDSDIVSSFLKSISDTSVNGPGKESEIHLNISGLKGAFNLQLMNENPESFIARVAQSSECQEDFFKDERVLHAAIDYHRSGYFHLPDICGRHLRKELESFGIPASATAPCCQSKLGKGLIGSSPTSSLRNKLRRAYSYPGCDIASIIFQSFQMLVLCAYLIILMSIRFNPQPDHRSEYDKNTEDNSTHRASHLLPAEASLLTILTLWFTFIAVLCPNKIEFMIKQKHFILFVVLVLQWIALIVNKAIKSHGIMVQYLLIAMQITRFLLPLPVIYRWKAMKVIGKTLSRSFKGFVVCFVLLVLSACINAYLLYVTEYNPEFDSVHRYGSRSGSLWDCLQYTYVSLTTVGYGDIVPVTLIGKACGILCVISSTLIIAMPYLELHRNFGDLCQD